MSRLSEAAGRVYRGETRIEFVERRKLWYAIAGAIVLLSVAALGLLRLNLGIEFTGGAEFRVPAASSSVGEVRDVVQGTGVGEPIVQQVGSDLRVQTPVLDEQQVTRVTDALSQLSGLPARDLSPATVGAAWGSQITFKALQGLAIFLVAVAVYLSVRFEPKMAIGAMVALVHDLVVTVGVYALLGFEVTPATVIGVLTILGYSLYDTVVVFDKVQETTRGLLSGSRMSYGEAANLAVNESLARSLNTSLIALLPVASLLFVGAGLLGAGTLTDLSLALFVGIAAGTYSSIFLATPVLVDLKEREPRFQALATRAAARRRSQSQAAATSGPAAGRSAAGSSPSGAATGTALLERESDEGGGSGGAGSGGSASPAARRPGARPAGNDARQAGKGRKGSRASRRGRR